MLYDNKKVLRSALRKNNNVWKYLSDMVVYLKSITVPVKVAWICALIQTINGLLQLSDDYFKNEEIAVTYILTKRKNSDCIENFFATVRGFNGYNRNPSVAEFNNMMGRLMSMKLISYASNLMNCEADEDEYLQHALASNDDPSTKPLESLSNSVNVDFTDLDTLLPDITNEKISEDTFEKNDVGDRLKLQDVSLRYYWFVLLYKMVLFHHFRMKYGCT